MTPSRQERIGRHEVAVFTAPRGADSLVQIVWNGDVSTTEARAVVDFFAPCVGQGATVFVTDLSRLGTMPIAAIRALAGTELPHPGTPRHFRLGYAVANLRTKVLASIIIRAAALTTRDTVDTTFFDSLDDAMAWGRAELTKP